MFCFDQKWYFSMSIPHIHTWGQQNEGAITNHLKTCEFNSPAAVCAHRQNNTDPVEASDVKKIILPGLDSRIGVFRRLFHKVNRYYQYKEFGRDRSLLIASQLRSLLEQEQQEQQH